MIRSILTLLLLFSSGLFAADITINDSFKQLNLKGSLHTALDIQRSSVEQIQVSAIFETSLYQQSISPNNDVYWYRIDVSANQLNQPKALVLVSENHLLQFLDVYLFKQDQLVNSIKLGVNDRPVSQAIYTGDAFRFSIDSKQTLTLLIRKQSDGPVIMPLSLMDEQTFKYTEFATLFLWGCAIGIFLALALYNGFIFSLNPNSAQYAWYMLFQLFMFLQFAPLHGFGYLIMPDALCRWLANHMGVLHLLTGWCALMFGQHFIDIKKFQPRIGWLIDKSKWVFPVVLVVSYNLLELQRMLINIPFIIIVSYVCISTAVIALKQRYSPASYYLLSWLCTVTGATCGYLTYINILPQNIITMHSFLIGSLAELYLLSISLAKRLQYQEKQKKHQRLIDQTLNLPNQNFYQHVAKEQFIARGIDLKRIKLVLIYLEGVDHLISALGTERVTSELNNLYHNISSKVSDLPWHIDLVLDKKYFCICIPPQQVLLFVTDDQTAEKQVEQLLAIWEQGLTDSRYLADLHMTSSSSRLLNSEDDFPQLHQTAYLALLEAQKRGLKWLPFNQQMTEKVEKNVRIHQLLKEALARQELDVYIQPQLDLTTNKVIAGEALMRWFHPSLGRVAPSVFIPIAEQGGLLHDLTRIAFEKMFAWLHQHPMSINLSINISVLDLQQKDFVDFLQITSEKYSVDVGCITLEITESQDLDNSVELLNKVKEIKNLGFSISIDDFGTGYSSMAYLSQLNIDEVKIDMMFVKGIQDNTTNQTIVKTLLNMADALGAQVVIEGIETEQELLMIRTLGGSVGQGYFWSPAIAMDEFEKRFL
ncbi:EAL domain-containing protein [Vibrio sp. TH_r3]|uniref:EAL domain-containing protein n=1 Tax=Vibrio sp. TH_r3 TaxID=3082084 RepID=UPI002953B67C|nr:EAL domain-containing protein [Vibrio sp. TH_r3]MDV7102812.1 EAL domain-containing protein [Vibrio sp. TH_r3]